MTQQTVRHGQTGVRLEGAWKDENGDPIDISSASIKAMVLQSPSGTTSLQGTTLSSDGTDGKTFYLTVAGDLSEPGVWRVQGYLDIGSQTIVSEVARFTVEADI